MAKMVMLMLLTGSPFLWFILPRFCPNDQNSASRFLSGLYFHNWLMSSSKQPSSSCSVLFHPITHSLTHQNFFLTSFIFSVLSVPAHTTICKINLVILLYFLPHINLSSSSHPAQRAVPQHLMDSTHPGHPQAPLNPHKWFHFLIHKQIYYYIFKITAHIIHFRVPAHTPQQLSAHLHQIHPP